MASLLMMGAGALVNALAFSGTNYMFHKLSASDEERKRHDLAIEKFQKDYNAWIKLRQNNIDAEQKRKRAARTAEDHMQELDASMREYARAWETANPEPKFYQYYHPNEDQKKKDYLSAFVAVTAIGVVAYYVL